MTSGSDHARHLHESRLNAAARSIQATRSMCRSSSILIMLDLRRRRAVVWVLIVLDQRLDVTQKNGAAGTTMRGCSRSAKRAPLMAYVPGPNQVREVRTAARGCCQHLRLSNCRPEMLVNGGLIMMPAASRSRSRSLATVRTVCEQHKRADLLWMLCAAPHGAPQESRDGCLVVRPEPWFMCL